MKTYRRILVTGTLTCLSDLHVGDGDLALQSERKTSASDAGKASAGQTTVDTNKAKVVGMISPDGVKKNEEQEKKSEGSYNTVCRDYQNRAYIPGSTLRGSLASFLNKETPFCQKFFGVAKHEAEKESGEREAGRLRVYDARLREAPEKEREFSALPGFFEERHTFLRHSVSISPVTGTAEKGKLFCYELVPKGSVFTVQFQIESRNKAQKGKPQPESLTEEEMAQLLALADLWNTEAAAIGSGVTKGYGRVDWKTDRVEALTPEDELRWLESDSLEPPPMISITDAVRLGDIGDISNLLADAAGGTGIKFNLNILPDGPFLINEPEYVVDQKLEPDLEYSRNGRNGKKALIPSRTLAGVIRGRVRRILATIAHQHYGGLEDEVGEAIEPLIKEFFGSEERRGALRLTEARGEATEHIQNFIGVDRFTGGVNKGANYKVRAADCEKLSAKDCLLDRRLLPDGDWWKGMLLLVLLDGMDGDMQIGWGKAKGYGRVRFQLTYGKDERKIFMDRQSLLKEIGAERAKQWVEALHDRIKSTVNVNETASSGGQA